MAGPGLEARQIGTQKKELAERHILRKEFWEQLLQRAAEKTDLHAQRSPTTESWLGAGAGKSGLYYHYRIRLQDAEVGLTIDPNTMQESNRIFDGLHDRMETIEDRFGGALEWRRQDDLRVNYVLHLIPHGGLRDRDRWPEVQEEMVDAMVRLEQALGPEINRLSQL